MAEEEEEEDGGEDSRGEERGDSSRGEGVSGGEIGGIHICEDMNKVALKITLFLHAPHLLPNLRTSCVSCFAPCISHLEAVINQ